MNNHFYIDDIPFKVLNRRGKAINCRIGDSKQLVFIPSCYFNKDFTLKENADLSWFMNKKDTRRKIELYKQEKEDV